METWITDCLYLAEHSAQGLEHILHVNHGKPTTYMLLSITNLKPSLIFTLRQVVDEELGSTDPSAPKLDDPLKGALLQGCGQRCIVSARV